MRTASNSDRRKLSYPHCSVHKTVKHLEVSVSFNNGYTNNIAAKPIIIIIIIIIIIM